MEAATAEAGGRVLIADGSAMEGVDKQLATQLLAASAAAAGDGAKGGELPARPWGRPFRGLRPGPGGAALEFFIKTDDDVQYCPGAILRYGAALSAVGGRWTHAWGHKDMPPELTREQAAALHGGGAPVYLWAGKGPFGRKPIIRDTRSPFHVSMEAYPGAIDPPFFPGPSYMLSGPLLLALAGTFPTPPQVREILAGEGTREGSPSSRTKHTSH